MNLLSSVLRFQRKISLRLDLGLIVPTVCCWLSVLLPSPPPLARTLLLSFSKLLNTFVFNDTTTLLSEVLLNSTKFWTKYKLHAKILTATGSKKSHLAHKRALCPLTEKTFTVFQCRKHELAVRISI